MITIKGVTNSTISYLKAIMGMDALVSTIQFDTPSLFEIILSDDVTISAYCKGFIVLIRNGNVTTLTNDDYVEITID